MKKLLVVGISLVLTLMLVLIVIPVNAKPSETPSLAPGLWSAGTEVAIDLELNPPPYTYFQLLANGVKVTAPCMICHDFRGGQFKWVAEIRQLVKGKWVKVPTTQGWETTEEGAYVACAQVPSAGTYALFGVYTGPKEIFALVDDSIEVVCDDGNPTTIDSMFEGQCINLNCDDAEPTTIDAVVDGHCIHTLNN